MPREPAPEAKLCRLRYAAGRIEACPEDRCPFWEPGGAVLEGQCAFEGIDFTYKPQLAGALLRIRKQLESAGTREEESEARNHFYRLLNESKGE